MPVAITIVMYRLRKENLCLRLSRQVPNVLYPLPVKTVRMRLSIEILHVIRTMGVTNEARILSFQSIFSVLCWIYVLFNFSFVRLFFSCNVVCFPSSLIKLPLRTLSSTFSPRIHHHSAHFTQSTQTLFANKFANTDFFTKGSDLFG